MKTKVGVERRGGQCGMRVGGAELETVMGDGRFGGRREMSGDGRRETGDGRDGR